MTYIYMLPSCFSFLQRLTVATKLPMVGTKMRQKERLKNGRVRRVKNGNTLSGTNQTKRPRARRVWASMAFYLNDCLKKRNSALEKKKRERESTLRLCSTGWPTCCRLDQRTLAVRTRSKSTKWKKWRSILSFFYIYILV